MATAGVSGRGSPYTGEQQEAIKGWSVWDGKTVERLFGSTGNLCAGNGKENAPEKTDKQGENHLQGVLRARSPNGIAPRPLLFQQLRPVPQQKSNNLCKTHPLPIVALGEQWQCPSDHLPVGMQIEDTVFVSWNVLHADHVQHWIVEENLQGLKGSVITQKQVLIQEGEILTSQREKEITRLICDMVTHGSSPKSYIALQECSDSFLAYLKTKLPPGYKLLESKTRSGCAVIYDAMRMQVQEFNEVALSEVRSKHLMEITLKRLRDKKLFRVVNVHVTGDPTSSSRKDLMNYVTQKIGAGPQSLVVAGDMNFIIEEMKQELQQGIKGSLQFCAPYRSNVGPMHGRRGIHAKAIDYFITRARENVRLLSPEEIFSGPNAQVIRGTLELFVDPKNEPIRS